MNIQNILNLNWIVSLEAVKHRRAILMWIWLYKIGPEIDLLEEGIALLLFMYHLKIESISPLLYNKPYFSRVNILLPNIW